MPNKRKKGKKLLAGWLPEEELAEFKLRAEQLGVTATDLLTSLIREEIRRSRATAPSTKSNKEKK